MNYRRLGRTALEVSEIGFGAWAIGGNSFGPVAPGDALNGLARAEELGCNFVDTAAVYGDSEALLGQFLRGRRDRWIIATKYSGQSEGLEATLEAQLRRLRTDRVDLYQLHWVPADDDPSLFEQLVRLREGGKLRYIGVSAYSLSNLDTVLREGEVDTVQLEFGLLKPLPLVRRLEEVRRKNLGVIVRSTLKGGFLTGKYSASTTFDEPTDQRSQWSRHEIQRLADAVERFGFLRHGGSSLLEAALAYPLAFPEVSTVIVSTKSISQADNNFRARTGSCLSSEDLVRIERIQRDLGLLRLGWRDRFRELRRSFIPSFDGSAGEGGS